MISAVVNPVSTRPMLCETTMIVRRSNRSATTPATGASTNIGAANVTLISPSARASPVRS